MTRPPKMLLVADDNLSMRQMLASFLESCGYRVEVAGDGAELLRLYRRLVEDYPPAVIITDLLMPRIDGFGVIRWIRHQDPHIPIVLMTTMCTPQIRRKASGLGAAAILEKPFEMEELLRTIAALVQVDSQDKSTSSFLS